MHLRLRKGENKTISLNGFLIFSLPWFKVNIINIMKTTFDLNIDLYQAFKQHPDTLKHGNKVKPSINKASFYLLVN